MTTTPPKERSIVILEVVTTGLIMEAGQRAWRGAERGHHAQYIQDIVHS